MGSELRQKKVLIVDDDDGLRELISEYLGTLGFEVLQAANGLDALLHVSDARPGAIVLDLGMPRLGGLEALRRIRKFDESIKVVVVTAATDAELHEQALALGAVRVLTKPLVLHDLEEALNCSGRPEPSRPSQTAPPKAAEAAASKGRVLIVDDDPELRLTMEELLSAEGYQTAGAASAGIAICHIVERQPDVVLLDIAMPELTGIEALPIIRTIAPDTAVIMVSSLGDLETAKRALAFGAFDYVVKPADISNLLRSLETAVKMKHARAERWGRR